MFKKYLFPVIVLCFSFTAIAQESDLTSSLYETYEKYKEGSLKHRRIKYTDILPLIETYRTNPKFEVRKVGTSIEGRSLNLISIGEGSIDVFLWSQMHGDEPTATQAIFDILHFLNSDDFKDEKAAILTKAKLHFLPMLNPDGAEVYQRRNVLGVDINRDALRLQSPESRTLKRVRDSLEADFGFNLHDQSRYYNAERTEKPATISYLAPPFNYERDINKTRADAMKVIAFMNAIIQKYAPGQVGRYSDDFEPRAFGDNIQKWGTSTILIESGGYPNDLEKQEIRKLNYVSILSAIYTIATKNYENIPLSEYEKIPKNDRKLFDLKIEKVTYNLHGNDYVIDIGIQRPEVDLEGHMDFWNSSRVMDQGDLSTYYGFDTMDAQEYQIIPGKIYPDLIKNTKELDTLDPYQLLSEGYTAVRVEKLKKEDIYSPVPLNLVSKSYQEPPFIIKPGINPSFLLSKNGTIEKAIINGFLIDLKTKESPHFKNAMIFR